MIRKIEIEPLKLKQEYPLERSVSWDWFDGQKHWWEVSVIVDGYNGSGGYWLRELWRWNNSSQILREDIKTLSWKDSRKVDEQVAGYYSEEARTELGDKTE